MPIFNGSSRTVNDLAKRVKRTFGDEAGVQITDTDIMNWINDGQREIVRENDILRKVVSTDSVIDQHTYPLTGLNVLSIQSVRYLGVPLEYLNFQEAEDRFTNDPQRIARGNPTVWYNFGGELVVYPTPDASVTSAFRLFYTSIPADVTNLGDTLSVPDIYFNTLVQYVLSQAHDLDEDYNAASMKKGEFNESMKLLSERESYSNNDAYPMITVSPEDM